MTGKMADDPEIPETGKKQLNVKTFFTRIFINNKYFSVIIILEFNLSKSLELKRIRHCKLDRRRRSNLGDVPTLRPHSSSFLFCVQLWENII